MVAVEGLAWSPWKVSPLSSFVTVPPKNKLPIVRRTIGSSAALAAPAKIIAAAVSASMQAANVCFKLKFSSIVRIRLSYQS